MDHTQQLEIEKKIDTLLDKLPVVTGQITERIIQIKQQEESCSSSTIKTSLENNFQLGAALLVNHNQLIDQAFRFSNVTDEINAIRYRSLIDYGQSIKDSIEHFESTAEGTKVQQDLFSTFTNLYEHQTRSFLNKFLSMLSYIYASAVVADLVLSANRQNPSRQKTGGTVDLVKSILGFAPNIGIVIGVGDALSAILKLINAHLDTDSSSPHLQTADTQLVHIEQQHECMVAILKLQEEIGAYIDTCMKYVLGESDTPTAADN